MTWVRALSRALNILQVRISVIIRIACEIGGKQETSDEEKSVEGGFIGHNNHH